MIRIGARGCSCAGYLVPPILVLGWGHTDMSIDFERIMREQTSTVRAFNAELVCLKDERIATNLSRNGIYERTQTAMVPQFARFGSNVFDVGANIGYYSVFLSTLVGVPGRVHAFEANPVTAGFLSATKERNGLDNLIVNNLAVSDSSKPLMVSYDPDFETARDKDKFNLGAWSLFRRKPGNLRVDCVTLDEYCDRHELTDVSFIKIDVQGLEENVLRGAKATMKKLKPVVMVEFNAKTPLSHDLNMHVMELLLDYGYLVARIMGGRYPYLRKLRPQDYETIPYGFYVIGLEPKGGKLVHDD
ncbi:MAG: FkbM family methyltransferase [Zavarzinia sp.]|nr:FkbM family methyltransferase [Zavarzinia sp.]